MCQLPLNFMQAPNYPDAGRCWDIVDKYKVSIFYTAPTLVRSLMREGDEARIPEYPFIMCISSQHFLRLQSVIKRD